jgi:hypothetical protein
MARAGTRDYTPTCEPHVAGRLLELFRKWTMSPTRSLEVFSERSRRSTSSGVPARPLPVRAFPHCGAQRRSSV